MRYSFTALACRIKACGRQLHLSAEQAAEQVCGKNLGSYRLVLEAMNNLPSLMQRAAVSPAITTQAGWAAELVATDNFPDLLPALTPDAVYTTAELSAVSLKRPATSANPAATRQQL